MGTQECIYLEFTKNVFKISGILNFKSIDQRRHIHWIFTFQHMTFHATYVRSIIGYCDVNAIQQKPPLRNFHVLTLYIRHQKCCFIFIVGTSSKPTYREKKHRLFDHLFFLLIHFYIEKTTTLSGFWWAFAVIAAGPVFGFSQKVRTFTHIELNSEEIYIFLGGLGGF